MVGVMAAEYQKHTIFVILLAPIIHWTLAAF